jgi:hypothetical protein
MKECRLWKPGSTPQKGLADQVLKHHQQQQKVSWMQISVLLNANNLPELADYEGAVPYISRTFRDISPPIWERPARQYKASPKLQAAASLDPLATYISADPQPRSLASAARMISPAPSV